MNLIFCDEEKLTDEIKGLMMEAFQISLRNELSDILDLDEFDIEASVSVVDNDEIQSLNKEYRNIDKVTDVLSFPQFSNKEDFVENVRSDAENLLGDVVICYDKACIQAEEYGTGIRREIVYLFVHSILHLLGYDHMNDVDKKEMRSREEAVMEELGL